MTHRIHAQTLIQAFEQWAPKTLAFEGDKIGLQIGTLDKKLNKVMITLDVLENVVDEAIEKGVDLIFAHHPVIFRPLKNMRTDFGQSKIVAKCIKHDIAVYVAHTNLDNANGGMNDWIADTLGLQDVRILIKKGSAGTNNLPNETNEEYGLGRIGVLPEALPLKVFAEHVKSAFQMDGVRMIGHSEASVKKVAVLGGDGNDFIQQAKFKGADVLVSGDIYYHTGHDAILAGLNVIDAGHHIEKVMKKGVGAFFSAYLRDKGYDTEVALSEANTNPFVYI